jgi:hypothetical protein
MSSPSNSQTEPYDMFGCKVIEDFERRILEV